MNLKKRCSTLLVCAVTLASLAIANLPSLTVSAQEPTEIVSKRTAYEKHYDNHDGTTTALIHSTPLHYLDDGEWRDINNTLMPGQDNNYVNTSNSMKVSLPKSTQLKTYSDRVGYEQFFFCVLGTPIDALYQRYYDNHLQFKIDNYYSKNTVEWANLVNAVGNYEGLTKTG